MQNILFINGLVYNSVTYSKSRVGTTHQLVQFITKLHMKRHSIMDMKPHSASSGLPAVWWAVTTLDYCTGLLRRVAKWQINQAFIVFHD
jgi:hypothetical protein